MEKVILKVETREGSGKGIAKGLRSRKMIPAVVYKGGKDALKLQLVAADLTEVLHTKAGENVIVTLKITGGDPKAKDKTVVIKEIQREPIKSQVLHVDFNEISLTETLKVNVPLTAHGEPEGKKEGGTLEHVMWELQIECLPTDIPEKIEVDVSKLKIGDAVYVKNVTAPEGVKVLTDPELIAMIVKPPKVEVPKEEVAVEAGSTEPELIRKKKEVEEEGEEGKKAEAKEAPKADAAKKEEKK
ncbi:MAG: 50S ribosomal protein L25 [Candidatus Omnitrophota bacterium]|nr:50S ribosomal protein L25 [Candidatus Omnitrophota bacterium]